MTTTIYTKTQDKITKITSFEEVFDVKKLNIELEEIETHLKILEKEPDNILVLNDEKFFRIEDLKNRKNKINDLLK